MRYVTAVHVPNDKKKLADNLISELRAPNPYTLERIHLNGRWRHEEGFSTYAFYTWWKPVDRFSWFDTLCADRELKILYFKGVSSGLSFAGYRALTAASQLSLQAKAGLWSGVKNYLSVEQTLYSVHCYVEGEQTEPMEVNSVLGSVKTIREPSGSLYSFYVTDYRDLRPLVQRGAKCLVQLGDENFVFNNNGLLPAQQGDMNYVNQFSKYLNLS